MPYGITQCYLPPGRGDIPAFTPAEDGTRFSDPGGMQGWVDLGGWLDMVYPHNGHPSWTNRARCWLTSLMRPTMLTTTPSCHPKKLHCSMWYTCTSWPRLRVGLRAWLMCWQVHWSLYQWRPSTCPCWGQLHLMTNRREVTDCVSHQCTVTQQCIIHILIHCKEEQLQYICMIIHCAV